MLKEEKKDQKEEHLLVGPSINEGNNSEKDDKKETGIKKRKDSKDKSSLKHIVIVTGIFVFTFICLRFTAESLIISMPFVAAENYQYEDNRLKYTSIFQTTAYMMGILFT